MTKLGVYVLMIGALTDFVITGGTALMAAMMANQSVMLPTGAAWLAAGLGGLVAAARTVKTTLQSPPNGGATP